ncbi:hypothetical protein AeMF1_007339, partial [Aphanomyces euteiches]
DRQVRQHSCGFFGLDDVCEAQPIFVGANEPSLFIGSNVGSFDPPNHGSYDPPNNVSYHSPNDSSYDSPNDSSYHSPNHGPNHSSNVCTYVCSFP